VGREVDLQLARRRSQPCGSLAWPAPLRPVPHDLATAAAVEVDPSVRRLQRQASRRWPGHDSVEAPPFVIDLDDVPGVDAFKSHECQLQQMPGRDVCRAAARGALAAHECVGLLAVRWLIDGMNVIGTRPDAWWQDRHAAMVRLVDLLERWAAAGGEEVTVVFEQRPIPPIRSTVIKVTHAPRPRRDAADDEIVRLLGVDSEPGAVRVVTSDLWLADRVHAVGASVESAAPFRALIEQS
jgi:predicted RNA-binding protein with PIN domain